MLFPICIQTLQSVLALRIRYIWKHENVGQQRKKYCGLKLRLLLVWWCIFLSLPNLITKMKLCIEVIDRFQQEAFTSRAFFLHASSYTSEALAKWLQHVGATSCNIVARNMLVGCVWPPCCTMLRSFGQTCSTCCNMSQQCYMQHVASVWPGWSFSERLRKNEHGDPLFYSIYFKKIWLPMIYPNLNKISILNFEILSMNQYYSMLF